jgi:hypothetical protein
LTELPSVPTTAVSLEAKSRSASSYIAFGLVFFGALIATVNIIYSIYLQLFVFLPSLPAWMGFQIYNYLILDILVVIGVLLMYGGAVIIYFEKSWPYGGIIALFGAFMSITLFAIFLGALGAFINLCSRPEPKRV